MMAVNRTFSNIRACGGLLRVYKTTTANLVIRLQNTAAVNQVRFTEDNVKTPIKPYSEIPGPKGAPFVGTLFERMRHPTKHHELLSRYFDKYGLIIKEKIGVMELVWLADLNGMETLLRHEGKYPVRIVLEPWRKWRDTHGHARGILTEDGPKWKRMRTTLDKQMMRPKSVANYTDRFNEVVTDFVARLRILQKSAGTGNHIPNQDKELFHWSLETIGTVLYETRFGGLSDNRSDEMAEFIQAVHFVLRTTEILAQVPPILQSILVRDSVKKHDWAWTVVMNTAKRLIDAKLLEIERKSEKGEDVSGFLSNIIASSTLSMPELYANISELMLGAVDTTSNTMQWMLYELSRDKKVQARLHADVTSVTSRGTIPTLADLEKMKYLRGVVKETLRMYPVAFVSRVLQEDLEILGYLIPAGKVVVNFHYFVGRRADIFPEPDKFQPERWIREMNDPNTPNPFSWLPFGFGTRMCVGKRVADLGMRLLLARLIQNFEVRATSSKPIAIVTKGFIVPERPVDVEFVERM